MSNSTRFQSAKRVAQGRYGEPSQLERAQDRQLVRWGGVAGLAGVALLLASAVVVGILGLPDASDVETLTDFADIETGRITAPR